MDDKKRKEDLLKKMEKVMEEAADTFVDDKVLKQAQEAIRRAFKHEEIPYTATTLKAFKEGADFMMAAFMNDSDKSFLTMLVMTVRKLLTDKKRELEDKVADGIIQNMKVDPKLEEKPHEPPF